MSTTRTLHMPATAPPMGWLRQLALPALAVTGGTALAWGGGWASLAGVALALGGAWFLRVSAGAAGSAAAAAAAEPARGDNRQGAGVMVEQIVPVWSRQIDVARELNGEGLNQILESFAQINGALQTVASELQGMNLQVDVGAVDGAVRAASPALDRLRQASQRAFDERERMVAELTGCAGAMAELKQLAKDARDIARHTRLVAFNASIEAHRSSSGAGTGAGDKRVSGGQAVAVEVRLLATRMAETAEKIEAQIHTVHARVEGTRRTAQVNDTTPAELALEIDLAARQALQALAGGADGALRGSADAQAAAQALSSQLDEVFVHFQFGDRVAQMLAIVGNDMLRFADWVAAHPQATQSDAAEWLTALDASYTMEEQRSHHHGTVHVQRDNGVEFF